MLSELSEGESEVLEGGGGEVGSRAEGNEGEEGTPPCGAAAARVGDDVVSTLREVRDGTGGG